MRIKRWRDVDLDFEPLGRAGDVSMVEDVAAIEQQMASILLTEKYDDPFHPETACGIRDLLFDQGVFSGDSPVQAVAKSLVENALKRWVDRIDVVDVVVDTRMHEIVLEIHYKIRELPEIRIYRSVLKRPR